MCSSLPNLEQLKENHLTDHTLLQTHALLCLCHFSLLHSISDRLENNFAVIIIYSIYSSTHQIQFNHLNFSINHQKKITAQDFLLIAKNTLKFLLHIWNLIWKYWLLFLEISFSFRFYSLALICNLLLFCLHVQLNLFNFFYFFTFILKLMLVLSPLHISLLRNIINSMYSFSIYKKYSCMLTSIIFVGKFNHFYVYKCSLSPPIYVQNVSVRVGWERYREGKKI